MDILSRIVLGGALLVVLCLGLKMALGRSGRGIVSGYNIARAIFEILLGLNLTWYTINPQSIPSFLTLELPNELRFGGLLVCVSGMILRGWCQRVLGKQWSADISLAQDHTLVTWGPYGVVRHPMYASYLLITPSLFVLTENWLVGIFAGSYTILSLLRIPAEDRLLRQHFGLVHEGYCQNVGKLTPKILGPLIKTSRPMGTLLVSYMVFIGFFFYTTFSWSTLLLVTGAFIGIHHTIMSYNDYVDRDHDQKKGKLFASRHPRALLQYVVWFSAATLGLLLIIAITDPLLAMFCGGVWVIGLAYSHFPGAFLVNNIVVALVAASPMLCGLVHTREVKDEPIFVFIFFVVLMLIREVYLDIKDAKIDVGYKRTFPTTLGHPTTWLWLINLNGGLALVVLPLASINYYVCGVATILTAALMFNHGILLNNPRWVGTCKWVMDKGITIFLIVLLLTQ